MEPKIQSVGEMRFAKRMKMVRDSVARRPFQATNAPSVSEGQA